MKWQLFLEPTAFINPYQDYWNIHFSLCLKSKQFGKCFESIATIQDPDRKVWSLTPRSTFGRHICLITTPFKWERTIEINYQGRLLQKLDIVYIFFSTYKRLPNELKACNSSNPYFFSSILLFFLAENQPWFFKWNDHNTVLVYQDFVATNHHHTLFWAISLNI